MAIEFHSFDFMYLLNGEHRRKIATMSCYTEQVKLRSEMKYFKTMNEEHCKIVKIYYECNGGSNRIAVFPFPVKLICRLQKLFQ